MEGGPMGNVGEDELNTDLASHVTLGGWSIVGEIVPDRSVQFTAADFDEENR